MLSVAVASITPAAGAAAEPPAAAATTDEGAAGAPPANSGLLYQDDRLTADVSGMSVHAVLMEIGRQSGARVRLEGVGDRQISGRFTRLPLEEALHRILGEENFTLVYGRAPGAGAAGPARLREIQVFGSGGSSVTSQRPHTPGEGQALVGVGEADPIAAAAGGMMTQLARVLEKHGEIQLPPGGSLAASLGSEQASFQQLVGLAMGENNRQLRAEAAEVLAGVFDSDPDARALLSAPGDAALDPEMVASFVRASGGPHAEEFLGDMAQHLKTPALRVKLNQIRARLHSPP